MKNKSTISVLVLLFGISYLMISHKALPGDDYSSLSKMETIDIPSDVLAIIDNKCSQCHRSDSKNSKSKSKLNYDKFTNGDYSNGKLVSKFGKLTKQLNGNKMPPKKYLGKNPDKKLTEEERALLLSWATEQSKLLSGE